MFLRAVAYEEVADAVRYVRVTDAAGDAASGLEELELDCRRLAAEAPAQRRDRQRELRLRKLREIGQLFEQGLQRPVFQGFDERGHLAQRHRMTPPPNEA